MSKISEKRALEAYPICNCYNEQCMMKEDVNFELRTGYEEGYDQSFKDFMKNGEKFLYLLYENSSIECENIKEIIEQFKIYMQNE